MISQQSVETIGNLLRLAGQNNTEATSTSTSAGDRLSVTGLNIPATTPVLISFNYRKSAGHATGCAFGLKVNATVVSEAAIDLFPNNPPPNTATPDAASDGQCLIYIGPRVTNFVSGAIGLWATGSLVPVLFNATGTNAFPLAIVTDIIIRGISGNVLSTHAVDELRVFTFPSLKG